jgi:hypothetical protein
MIFPDGADNLRDTLHSRIAKLKAPHTKRATQEAHASPKRANNAKLSAVAHLQCDDSTALRLEPSSRTAILEFSAQVLAPG